LPNIPNILSNLQAFLSGSVQGAVTQGSAVANFENLYAGGASGNQAVTVANNSVATGLLDITNTNTNGSVLGGTANISVNVPVGYNFLVVQAPGTETINGNGSNNFLGVFGSQSGVTFNSGAGGSGTIAAGGSDDFVVVAGTTWSVVGNASGSASVATAADSSIIQVFGQGNAVNNAIGAVSTPSNVVGLFGSSASVVSSGTNDLIETYSGSDTVTANGSANILVNGGAITVFASSISSAVRAGFNLNGGTLDFINNSSTSATVSGDVPGASGGSLTVFGGAGGGAYVGGNAGNNSLIGGSGIVNLVAAGTNNIVSVSGYGSLYGSQNVLQAGSGGATLVAASTTGFNEFHGGSGTDSIVSFGSGAQTYYVGASGAESLTGSTQSGAVNTYIFNQDSTGAGQDAITNFRLGTDHIFINGNGTLTGVTISDVTSLGGGHPGTLIFLSDSTTIQLFGVNASSISPSVVGTTTI
jgi:hypothetical protein